MPRVPRISEDRIKQTAVPNVRVSTATDPAAFGGGASAQAVSNAATGLNEQAMSIIEAEIKRADDAKIADSASKLSEFENEFMNQALQKRGENSFTLPEEYNEAFNNRAEEIGNELKGDRQKTAFENMKLQYNNSMMKQINRHVRGETLSYHNQKTDALIENELTAAANNFNDPERIALSLERQEQAIDLFGEDNGLPQELIDAKKADAKSRTHIAVIDNLISHDSEMAEAYYEASSSEINTKNMSIADLKVKINAFHKRNVDVIEDAIADKEISGELTPSDILSVSHPINEGGMGKENARKWLTRIKKAQKADLKDVLDSDKNQAQSKQYVNLVNKLTDDNVSSFELKQLLIDAHADQDLTREEKGEIASVIKILKDVEFSNKEKTWLPTGWGYKKSIQEVTDVLRKADIDDIGVKKALKNVISTIKSGESDPEMIKKKTEAIISEVQTDKNPAQAKYEVGTSHFLGGVEFVAERQADGTIEMIRKN